MVVKPNPKLPLIPLSIGDPTLFKNLLPPETCVKGIIESLTSNDHNGYLPSFGSQPARQAVAEYLSTSNHQLTAQDVILCSGASSSLDLCISVLANPGDNILIPRPGFSLYLTLADSLEIETRHYNLLPELDWEIDLEQVEKLIDSRTRALLVNNPSNPCGSVFTRQHMLDIVKLAEKYKLPIISDEIYHELVFENVESILFSSLTDVVPVLSCGGLAKRFMIPGWRLGWIVIYDKQGYMSDIRSGLIALSTRIMGANSLVQGALPKILKETDSSYYKACISQIQKNAELAFEKLSNVTGLMPIMPRGAMYMMIGIDMERFPPFKNDCQFAEAMISEVSVFCLPATCFKYPNYVRIVLTLPENKMKEACERIALFCENHFQSAQEHSTVSTS
jgi:tyrosine aminotransferase